jgi:protein-S-isoprenylcysteine O-methyltransferase Ste14
MNERSFFDVLLLACAASAAVTFPVLFFVSAPYGRHAREGFGPKVSSTAGWLIMEVPAAIVLPILFAMGHRTASPAAIAFLVLWQAHYVYRALIFPFRRRGAARQMPLVIAGLGFTFNLMNGYLNGRWLFSFSDPYPTAWLFDPRFIIGTCLFAAGLTLNHQSDEILRRLRRPGETGYKIPSGGMYRWVSCPNYLGEIIEWTGWAIATWSLPGLFFAVWTFANLVPRGWEHHGWYREKFADYPKDRRAVIPFVF